jgi:hypothetical protein
MADAEKRLILSIIASIFFGYSGINCLLFYRRTRDQAANYRNRPFAAFLHSSRFGPTLWLTGIVGAIGFVISSWQVVLSLLVIWHGR